MRLFVLYLKSRAVLYSGMAVLVIVMLAWIGAYLLLLSPYAVPELRLIPVILFAPLTVACIAGTSTHNPFGEIETTSSHPLAAMRLLHLSMLLIFASFALSLISSGWNLSGASAILTRNIIGFSGMAFISSWIAGSGLSWIPPLIFAAAVQLNGRDPNGELALWAWPLHPSESLIANSLAAALLVAGLLIATLYKPGYGMKLLQILQTKDRKGGD